MRIARPPDSEERLPWRLALLALAMLFILAGSGVSQVLPTPAHKRSEWFSYKGDHEIKGKWALHLDGSWRRMDDANWVQGMVSPGLNYQVSPSVQVAGAYVYFMTRPGGLHWSPASYPEHRIQGQITIARKLWSIPLRHRFRAEQRFQGSGARDGLARGWNRQQRARYMLRGDIPLKRGQDGRAVLSLGLYDEIFFHVGRNAGAMFDQNRIYAGITYRPSRTLAFECGAFTQRHRRETGGLESSAAVLVSVSSTAPLRHLFGRR